MTSVCLWSYCDVAMVLIIYQQIFGLLLQTQRVHINTTQNMCAKKVYFLPLLKSAFALA